MNHNDFWDNLVREANLSGDSNSETVDGYLSGRSIEADFNEVRALTDKYRHADALSLPVAEGTKVVFAANLGSVMAYTNPPAPNATGAVVTVKTASGNVTSHEGKVFVAWEDGHFRPVHAEHLRLADTGSKKQTSRRRVASLDLTEFLKVAEDTLVHKATRDLWSFRHDGGAFVLERLFDSSGDPLKA